MSDEERKWWKIWSVVFMFLCAGLSLAIGKHLGRVEQAKIDAAHPVLPEDERLKYFLQGRNQQKLEQVAKCEPPWVLSVEKINGIGHFTCAAPAGLSLPPGKWSCSEHGCSPL